MKIVRRGWPAWVHRIIGVSVLLAITVLTGYTATDYFHLIVRPVEPKGEVFLVQVFRSYKPEIEGGVWGIHSHPDVTKSVGFHEAVTLLKEHIANPPANYTLLEHAYGNLADVYKSRGRYNEAVQVLEEGVQRHQFYWLRVRLGVAYRDAQRYDDAIRVLRQTIDSRPGFDEGPYELARTYKDKGDYDAAINVLKHFIQTYPIAHPVWLMHYELGLNYSAANKCEEAISSFQRAIELEQQLANKLGRSDARKEHVVKELQLARGRMAAEFKQLIEPAATAERSGQLREALRYYLSALRHICRDSDGERELRQRIIKLVQGLTPPPAIPEDARRYLVHGVTATKEAKTTADYEKAVKEFQLAGRLAPWWADAYLNLAIAQEGAGKYADAAKSLEFFLLAAPNDPEAKRLQNKIYELEYKAKTAQKK